MNAITVVVLVFSLLGALDRIFGNRFGLGAEFERGFHFLGIMALSMIGMIIIAPAFGAWLKPMFEGFYTVFGIDPSVLPASIFANDMGGASLAFEVCKDNAVGAYNALVVSSMLGCVLSFTVPFALGAVDAAQHKELFFGFLCGIVTIPVGCIVSGFLCGLTATQIFLNLLPLLVLSAVIAAGLLFVPNISIKLFRWFGVLMKVLITVGLACGVFTFLTGVTLVPEFDRFEAGANICVNAAVTMSGAFPMMFVVSKLLRKPMTAFGKKLGVNATSAVCFVSTIMTSVTTFGLMKDMDKKGVALNAAFAVSASFAVGSHLGFTMAYDPAYVTPMIVGKLVAGVAALALAVVLYDRTEKKAAAKESVHA